MTDFLCNCCSLQKDENNLTPVKSTLLGSQQFLLCGKCLIEKHSPRWVIILAARTAGLNARLQKIIKQHAYCGNEITGTELL
jgi:hypothetical protein